MEPLHPTEPSQIYTYFPSSRLSASEIGPAHPARSRFSDEADLARRISRFHTAQTVGTTPDSEPLRDQAPLLPNPGAIVTYIRRTEHAVAYRLAG